MPKLTPDTPLPFPFDLLYDIKTLGELHDHLTGVRRTATSATDQQLLDLMVEYGTPMPEEYSAPAPSLTDRYAEAMSTLRLLLTHLTPTSADGDGSGPDTGWMRNTIQDMLARHPQPPATHEDDSQSGDPFVFGLYESASAAPPVSASWPFDEELWQAHVDTDDLVTFRAMVPLDTLVRGEDALLEYCAEAFNGQAELRSAEFRAIGGISDNEDFSSQFVGDIPLQVTCSLHSTEE